jgi:hypothetical protein
MDYGWEVETVEEAQRLCRANNCTGIRVAGNWMSREEILSGSPDPMKREFRASHSYLAGPGHVIS